MRQSVLMLQTLLLLSGLCCGLLSSTAEAQNFTFTFNPTEKTAWQTWCPKYDTTVSFTAALTGDTEALTSTTYTFTLSEVSDWPGYCMNKGTESDASKDLEFRAADNPSGSGQDFSVSADGQTLTFTCTGVVMSVTIKVRVLDYAAERCHYNKHNKRWHHNKGL